MLRPQSSILIFFVLLTGGLAGCTPPPRADISVSTQSDPDQQIIALVNRSPITRDQLDDDLSERAGRQALTDLILDRLLETRMHDLDIELSADDLAFEESLFVRTFDAIAPDAPASLLLGQIKVSQGLGPHRYPRLIRRNAMLRRLASEDAKPTEPEYQLAERIAFGQQFQIRLLVCADRSTAIAIRQDLSASTSDALRWIFAQHCMTSSIHPSAPRGGLITEMSPDDPTYPITLADTVRLTEPGQLSPVISLPEGYALMLVESLIPASSPSAEQINTVRTQLELRKARVEMERLAGRLLKEARVVVTDRALNWTWTNQP